MYNGMVRKDVCSEEEVRRQIQAGANALWKVGGGHEGQKCIKKLKGKDCSERLHRQPSSGMLQRMLQLTSN